jgi:L-threonylcarbamoyladenylate synthase
MGVTLKVNLEDPEDPALAYAADLIRVGGLVVYPTDTLYGIGANAFSLRAVTAVYEVKRREKNKPLLVLVDSIESLTPLVREIPPFAHKMMDAFWPGPMTLVFNTSSRLPEALIKNEKTLAIRIPKNRWCMSLLKKAGCPITATSANISGQPTPRTIDDIQSQLGPAVDLYLDAGELPESKPSTVVDVTGALPRLLREGAISLERIKEIVPDIHS